MKVPQVGSLYSVPAGSVNALNWHCSPCTPVRSATILRPLTEMLATGWESPAAAPAPTTDIPIDATAARVSTVLFMVDS